jgi:hypothetical protein
LDLTCLFNSYSQIVEKDETLNLGKSMVIGQSLGMTW